VMSMRPTIVHRTIQRQFRDRATTALGAPLPKLLKSAPYEWVAIYKRIDRLQEFSR
jgi:hypothetical protein